jgi:hypothetical protein
MSRLVYVGLTSLGILLGASMACGCPDVKDVALAEGSWSIAEDPTSSGRPALFEEDGVDWTAVEIVAGNDTLVFNYYNPANDSTWRVEYLVSTADLGAQCGEAG